jgi:MFS family permease
VLLAVRWIAGLFFGPLAGALSDRFGMANALTLLSIILVSGVYFAVTATGLAALAALSIALLAGSGLFVTLNAAASEVALSAQRPHHFVGVFSTAIDAGAAAGPLLAFSLGRATGLEGLYLATCALFGLAILRFRGTL